MQCMIRVLWNEGLALTLSVVVGWTVYIWTFGLNYVVFGAVQTQNNLEQRIE